MALPKTEGGYNLFDMLSMMQKGIRRGKFNEAGFAANQCKKTYRKAMWNRLLVISSEDCFGIVTKEIVRLMNEDTDPAIAKAVALLCKARKSRDACYFSCNFVLVSRKPREIIPNASLLEGLSSQIVEIEKEKLKYDESGFEQMSLFDIGKEEEPPDEPEVPELTDLETAAAMLMAIEHRDMDMLGYMMDQLRFESRENLWAAFQFCANISKFEALEEEIKALHDADAHVNAGKKDKDEIFISKAAMVLCYHFDDEIEDIMGDEIIPVSGVIDWKKYRIKPTDECKIIGRELPDWVFDCHTLRGKREGKTDWDMTTTEQAALNPLRRAYFDEGSWIYTYEWDYEHGVESEEHMKPIRKYAETHPANPVEHLPYENSELLQ